MQFVSSAPNNGHEIRVLQQPQVFRHRLPRHIHAHAKLAQRLPVIRLQTVQQFPAGRIGQRFEHLVHIQLYATFWLHVNKKISASRIRLRVYAFCAAALQWFAGDCTRIGAGIPNQLCLKT